MRFDAIHRYGTVDSTNRLAAEGNPGEVFVAEEQTAGRGRLEHRWYSRPRENLLLSVVLDVTGILPLEVATFPLVAGLTVVKSIGRLLDAASAATVRLKWPNDVYIGGRKVCGIICERHDEKIVVGIGVNVRQTEFPEEIAEKATSLAREGVTVSVDEMTDRVLEELGEGYERWRRGGFAALHPELVEIDFLKGREVTVMRTDDDGEPTRGICGGIAADGSLLVGGENVYAGEVRF